MTNRSLPTPPRPVFTWCHHAWLSLGLALFIVYGSLVPFHSQPLSWEEAVARFREVCSVPVRVNSRSDFLANFVLVVPLGYLLMGALCVDRPRRASLAILAVLPCCLCLSIGVEFAQLWFPPRVSSLNDIVAQSIGAILGVAIWLVAGQRLTDWARGVWGAVGQGTLAARLLPGYLALLVLIYGMPFDLTLSPADLYHKFRDGRVQLVPFARHGESIYKAVEKDCWNVALFLPLGLLLEHLPGLGGRGRRSWQRILGLGVLAAVLIQGLKLLVFSRFVDATEVVTGSLAVLAGWGLALTLRQRRLAAGLSGEVPDEAAARQRRTMLLGLLMLAWLAAAVFANWQPFDFSLNAGQAAERLGHVPLLPFADYYEGDYWNSFDQFVRKTLLFLPFGVLLTLTLPSKMRSQAGIVVFLAAAAVAACMEAGQLFLPKRCGSFTDILVESCGAWVGMAFTRHARSLLEAPAERPWAGAATLQSPAVAPGTAREWEDLFAGYRRSRRETDFPLT